MAESPALLAILLSVIVFCQWLSQKNSFRMFGAGLLILMFSAVLANIGIIPTAAAHHPLYQGIFSWVAPVSISLILLNVNLSSLRLAGKPMLILFAIGSIGTMAGAAFAMILFEGNRSFGTDFFALGGMYTATYIGGGLNFNAVAAHYNVVQNGNLFVAATVADNILSAVWVMVTLAAPAILQKYFPARDQTTSKQESIQLTDQLENKTIHLQHMLLLLAISLFVVFLSGKLVEWLPQIPSVIWVTTLSLIAAHVPEINQLKGHYTLGMLGMYLLLAVIGAHCDLAALFSNSILAWRLMGFVIVLTFTHGLIIFIAGWWWRKDWYLVSIASQANIGGTSTAMALAQNFARTDLILPGVIAGSIGNATGTYLGIAMAEWMKVAEFFQFS
jgi:uncharacterized membrane protein